MKERIPIELPDGKGVIKLSAISAQEYYEYDRRKSIPIFEDYDVLMQLHLYLDRKLPENRLSRIYMALKANFGESNTTYDDWKCSFGFQFLLTITRDKKESLYTLNLCDLKGGINLNFRKILHDDADFKKHGDKDSMVLHEALQDDFSKSEMRYFSNWFIGYLIGFISEYEKNYDEPFARSQEYCRVLYGFSEGEFFEEYYSYEEDEGENEKREAISFEEAKAKLLADEIPFNLTKPND